MKYSYKVLMLILLSSLLFNPAIMAKKSKLNLKLFDSPPDFSSDVSSASSIMGSRNFSKNMTSEKRPSFSPCLAPCPAPMSPTMASPPKSQPVAITPDKAKVFNSDPVFEWAQPICKSGSECYLTIVKKSDNDIQDDQVILKSLPIGKNSYVFDGELLPGSTYTMTLTKTGSNPLNITFYTLGKDQKVALDKQLSQLKSDDDYSKKVSQLELYFNNALWYDVVASLNGLISEYPEDASLQEFKSKLYYTVKNK